MIVFELLSDIKTTFIAERDSFIMNALIFYEERDRLIACVPLLTNNAYMFFGKGVGIDEMISLIKTCKSKQLKAGLIKVSMFSKRLIGKFNTSTNILSNW